jgi:hypothetical protein
MPGLDCNTDALRVSNNEIQIHECERVRLKDIISEGRSSEID